MANLMATVAGKLNPKDFEALAAATPEGIGRTVLKPVLSRYRLSELYKIAHSEQKSDLIEMLNKCDGVSDINAEKIIQGLLNPVIEWALNGGDLNVVETYVDSSKKTTVSDNVLKVCITGKIELFKNRDEFVAALETKGHSFASSVSKDTDILVTNDPFSGSSKNQKATKLGKPIMTEREFVATYLE